MYKFGCKSIISNFPYLQIIAIAGNFDQALEAVVKISENNPITLVNSLNPYRIEGQKTGAFEVCDALGKAPDYHFIPVGNAGNITAYWKGYKEYFEKGKTSNLPIMMNPTPRLMTLNSSPRIRTCTTLLGTSTKSWNFHSLFSAPTKWGSVMRTCSVAFATRMMSA